LGGVSAFSSTDGVGECLDSALPTSSCGDNYHCGNFTFLGKSFRFQSSKEFDTYSSLEEWNFDCINAELSSFLTQRGVSFVFETDNTANYYNFTDFNENNTFSCEMRLYSFPEVFSIKNEILKSFCQGYWPTSSEVLSDLVNLENSTFESSMCDECEDSCNRCGGVYVNSKCLNFYDRYYFNYECPSVCEFFELFQEETLLIVMKDDCGQMIVFEDRNVLSFPILYENYANTLKVTLYIIVLVFIFSLL
jgi:hypothetical protein